MKTPAYRALAKKEKNSVFCMNWELYKMQLGVWVHWAKALKNLQYLA